jgi:negative regulator of flagellin synthesis FlgM
MIKSIGQGSSVAIEAAKLRDASKAAKTAKTGAETERSTVESVSSPVSRMAAEGAPVDTARIERIKAAIASGNYPVNPERIAERMVDLDLPEAQN